AVAVVAAVVLKVAVIGRFHIGNVQKAVAANAEIYERRLNTRLDVDNPSLVDVADVALLAGTLDVELLQDAILEDGNAALFRLEYVDKHVFLHENPFRCGSARRQRLPPKDLVKPRRPRADPIEV